MRYCQSCGSDLQDTAKFCSSCGAKCEEQHLPTRTSRHGKYYRKKKSKLPWLIIALVVILITTVGISGYKKTCNLAQDMQQAIISNDSLAQSLPYPSKASDKYPIEVIQSITNNLQNTYTGCDGQWLYDGSAGLNKIPLTSEGRPIKIFEEYTPGAMFCLGDKLYMSIGSRNFSYVPLDNLAADPICPVGEASCFQTDGIYYYVDFPANYNAEKGVYRVSVENPKEYEFLFEALPTKLLLQGDYLYVVSAYGKINGVDNPYYGTWRIDLDGGNPILITDNNSNYMIFGNDRIYWQDDDYSLYSTALDGTDRIDFGVKFDHSLNVNDKYIFYLDQGTHYLYRMDLDGQNSTCLVRNRCSDFGLWGDWIVYENLDDYEYYKINIVDNIHCKIEWP